MTCGIYKITCSGNGKFYIGSSKNIENRYKGHLSKLKGNRHENNYLQNVSNKYGVNTLNIVVLDECVLETLLDQEQARIDEYINDPLCLNLSPVARGGFDWTKLPNAEETRRKISDFAKTRTGDKNPFWGKEHTDVAKQKIIAANLGKTYSVETKLKQSLMRKGVPKTEEWKRKIGEAQLGEKNHMFGKDVPMEVRKKRSDKMKGRNNCQICRRVSVNNVIFESVMAACRATNLKRHRLRHILDTQSDPYIKYV